VVEALGAGLEELPGGLATSDFGYLMILQKTATADVTIVPADDAVGGGTRRIPADTATAVSYGPMTAATLGDIELHFSAAGEVYVSWDEVSG
jgi:hypothetical protein